MFHSLQRSRRRSEALRREAAGKDKRLQQNLDVTRLITAQQCKKTEKHVNQLLHIEAGDLTANNDHAAVVLEISVSHCDRVFERKDRHYDDSTS